MFNHSLKENIKRDPPTARQAYRDRVTDTEMETWRRPREETASSFKKTRSEVFLRLPHTDTQSQKTEPWKEGMNQDFHAQPAFLNELEPKENSLTNPS